jgi:hypothetical protein
MSVRLKSGQGSSEPRETLPDRPLADMANAPAAPRFLMAEVACPSFFGEWRTLAAVLGPLQLASIMAHRAAMMTRMVYFKVLVLITNLYCSSKGSTLLKLPNISPWILT